VVAQVQINYHVTAPKHPETLIVVRLAELSLPKYHHLISRFEYEEGWKHARRTYVGHNRMESLTVPCLPEAQGERHAFDTLEQGSFRDVCEVEECYQEDRR
jgi:hypothetical protein